MGRGGGFPSRARCTLWSPLLAGETLRIQKSVKRWTRRGVGSHTRRTRYWSNIYVQSGGATSLVHDLCLIGLAHSR